MHLLLIHESQQDILFNKTAYWTEAEIIISGEERQSRALLPLFSETLSKKVQTNFLSILCLLVNKHDFVHQVTSRSVHFLNVPV
jgi:hypothetical protein